MEQGIVLGVEGQRLQPVIFDSRTDPGLVVIGDAETGKTSTLRAVGRQVVDRYEPRQAKVILFDFRRNHAGRVRGRVGAGVRGHREPGAGPGGRPGRGLHQAAAGSDITPQQLRQRSWWTGPDVYVIVDDYDLVAAGANPLLPLLPFLSQARDIGLYPYVARRAGGATRALLDPFLSAMRELGYPAVVLSAPRDEARCSAYAPPSCPGSRHAGAPPARHGAVQLARLETRHEGG